MARRVANATAGPTGLRVAGRIAYAEPVPERDSLSAGVLGSLGAALSFSGKILELLAVSCTLEEFSDRSRGRAGTRREFD